MKTECIGENVKLNGKTYPCTVSLAMDLIGGKWKTVILYHLKTEPKRYSELLKEMHTVTEMTLSIQLKKLEQDGLISRKVYGKKPPVKVVYSLTDFGKTLIPTLEAITAWGNQITEQSAEFVNFTPLPKM
ncbi:HxlR family transcriptional regulator [Pedobacter sp. Leaf216]|uniref:winged helix-turn-helix transcriptional regulator n=1 Tax=Pedobacter sp. Leaf216 TaxID=1735684 RepID=UPI000700EC9F|nr:helix-turn-helix domain-containing protein [Pedobacter sp. Leaf216]KQM69351.1 HxlR family transcriptional regulator [Pedobacter sp. Leaf216]